MKHLVVGLGEVGKAIKEVMGCDGIDRDEQAPEEHYDVLDVCIPYSAGFVATVQEYAAEYDPKYIVIHSTVPIGTSEQLNAHHSPVRGKHPHLAQSLTTFVKYLGGAEAKVLAEDYNTAGIYIRECESARDCEALKLWDTTQLGDAILLEKEIHAFCKENRLDFDLIYTEANRSYNAGYEKMGYPYFARPMLDHVPGKIGGHCVVPNCKLLESPTASRIFDANEKL